MWRTSLDVPPLEGGAGWQQVCEAWDHPTRGLDSHCIVVMQLGPFYSVSGSPRLLRVRVGSGWEFPLQVWQTFHVNTKCCLLTYCMVCGGSLNVSKAGIKKAVPDGVLAAYIFANISFTSSSSAFLIERCVSSAVLSSVSSPMVQHFQSQYVYANRSAELSMDNQFSHALWIGS